MRPRGHRGAALLLVLVAVAVLTVVAVDLAGRASAESVRATRSSRDAAYRRLVDSGFEVTRSVLLEQPPGSCDHWGQPWNRELEFALGEGERAVVRLADESGKLNVGLPWDKPVASPDLRARVRRLFEYLARHSPRNGKNWKAMGNKVLARLESGHPLVTLDGLRDVGLSREEVFSPEGLARYLTCFGDGRINLNTAPCAVLYSLDPSMDDAMIEGIAGFRGRREVEPGSYRPFENAEQLLLVPGIANYTVVNDPGSGRVRGPYERIAGRVSTKSACFSARVQATAMGKERLAWIFLKPDGSRLAVEEILP